MPASNPEVDGMSPPAREDQGKGTGAELGMLNPTAVEDVDVTVGGIPVLPRVV